MEGIEAVTEPGCIHSGLPARGKEGDATSGRKLTKPGGSSMPSAIKESVWLADQNAENSFKNYLTAYPTDIGGKLRRWKESMEKRPEFTNRLKTIYQLHREAPMRGGLCLSGVG